MAEKLPEIKFEKTTIDFGNFTYKDPKKKAEFKFTNTGRRPLFILKVQASCGCTSVDYPRDAILPGKSGVIKVDYNGENRVVGAFQKVVYVTTNAPSKTTRLVIKGNMTLLD